MKKFFTAMIFLTTILLTGCGNLTVERSENLMGTVITLKATGANAQVAVDESFLAIDALIKNIFADVKKIEASDDFVEVSPDVYKILETSQKFSELTNGAFDVTCGAAIELWGFRNKNFRVPTDDELADVKNFVGYEHLQLRDGKIRVDKRGVKINLGGVAKGYGVDIVRKIFAAHGISDGLIDFGTSTIFAFGVKKIGIKNPTGKNFLSVVELKNSVLSTSGDYEKFFVANGRRYCHIIDPKSCAPVDAENFSVTVVVDGSEELCATVADILSTAAFVDRERVEKILSSCKLPAKIIRTQ
ncbi:MAG: FAD:protein FMN transferase [Selenomonadaceae bacterium]|nr:FAD:protein FMN transferase [Selenomonadaceae bacterium]